MNRRDEIRARLDAATPGPWTTVEPCPRFITCPTVEHVAIDEADWGEEVGNIMQLVMASDPRAWRYADVRLVAHAPADLRDLLAVAEAAREIQDWRNGSDAEWLAAHKRLHAALARFDAVTDGERHRLSQCPDEDCHECIAIGATGGETS